MMDSREINLSAAERFVRAHIQHYDEDKYWRRREKVVSLHGKGLLCKFINYCRLFYIKRCDAFNNASREHILDLALSFIRRRSCRTGYTES